MKITLILLLLAIAGCAAPANTPPPVIYAPTPPAVIAPYHVAP
jgi:hypothetical protein